ncbi:unnamed protein product [Nippostrongylus brasiliensis]|uniref:TIGR02217 family protein n=1 Tax=Nippostrongylus brasiliensis TaxID=27835 RepID=A0A0N4YWJ7_NIPBR|nr:unnamed protein product [Nippostrongylus brasiliensis]
MIRVASAPKTGYSSFFSRELGIPVVAAYAGTSITGGT